MCHQPLVRTQSHKFGGLLGLSPFTQHGSSYITTDLKCTNATSEHIALPHGMTFYQLFLNISYYIISQQPRFIGGPRS
jgi:hypothetical protein